MAGPLSGQDVVEAQQRDAFDLAAGHVELGGADEDRQQAGDDPAYAAASLREGCRCAVAHIVLSPSCSPSCCRRPHCRTAATYSQPSAVQM